MLCVDVCVLTFLRATRNPLVTECTYHKYCTASTIGRVGGRYVHTDSGTTNYSSSYVCFYCTATRVCLTIIKNRNWKCIADFGHYYCSLLSAVVLTPALLTIINKSRFSNLGKGIFRGVFDLKIGWRGLHSGIVVHN